MGLTDGLIRAARLRGRHAALIDGTARYGWAELAGRVARLAGAFQALGVMPGDRVAILAANSHRHLQAQYAILWLGGIILPLNGRLTMSELTPLLGETTPRLLLFDAAAESQAQAILALPGGPVHGIMLGDDGFGRWPDSESLTRATPPLPHQSRAESETACLFYTGGTTGEPKGVMLSHGNLLANSVNFIAGSGMDERVVHLHCGPLFHVAAAARIFSVTLVGGRHVMLPRFAAEAVLDTIEAEQITLATFVPTMAKDILASLETTPRRLPSLEIVTYGAAPMPLEVLTGLMAKLPHVRFVQSYGQTELSPIATMLGAADHSTDAVDNGRIRSAGKPALLADLRILDSDGRDLPQGEIGEIAVRGPMVMQGYWKRPDLTAKALRDGWLHSGDAGYLDADGYLHVVDRLKDMIISGGENVYSIEVENALYSHPDVLQCAVFGVPHPRWGEAVHAAVVPRAGARLEPAALIQHCRTRIAAYKCPLAIDIRTEPLPLSGVNKVLKAALRAPFWTGHDRKAGASYSLTET